MNYSDGIMNIDISPILIQEIKLKYPEAFIWLEKEKLKILKNLKKL
jgi:hypothetical protein